MGEQYGAQFRVSPTEAPWQHGLLERVGQAMEDIFIAIVESVDVQGPEKVEMALLYTAVAFNRRPDRSGFSPRARVFGNEEKIPGSVLDNLLDGEELAGLDMAHGDEVYKRSLMVRDAAMIALTKLDMDARWWKAMVTNVPADRG